jgi:hypothetical protein
VIGKNSTKSILNTPLETMVKSRESPHFVGTIYGVFNIKVMRLVTMKNDEHWGIF